MPVRKPATRGTYRRAEPKPRSRAKVQARHERQDAERQAAERDARAEAEQQHAHREHALRLVEHMNAIVQVQRETAALVDISLPEQRRSLEDELHRQYHRARETLERYTNPWRDDWIDSARDGEEMHETIDRILAERGMQPHRHRGQRDRTKERRLDARRRAIEERLAHDRSLLAAYGDQRALDDLDVAAKWGRPFDRFGNEISRRDIEADIARAERALASLPEKRVATRSDVLARFDAVALRERREREK